MNGNSVGYVIFFKGPAASAINMWLLSLQIGRALLDLNVAAVYKNMFFYICKFRIMVQQSQDFEK